MGVAVTVEADAAVFRQLAETAPGVEVIPPKAGTPAPGQKGGGIDLATFGLALVTSGAVTALVQVLQHYLGRNTKAAVSFEAPDGRKMSISSENMKPEQVEETAKRLKSLFEAE